jgi:hypothetical protein
VAGRAIQVQTISRRSLLLPQLPSTRQRHPLRLAAAPPIRDDLISEEDAH